MQIKNYLSIFTTIALMFTFVVWGFSNNLNEKHGHSYRNYKEHDSEMNKSKDFTVDVLPEQVKYSYLYECLNLSSEKNNLSLKNSNFESSHLDSSTADDCLRILFFDGEHCSEYVFAYTRDGVEPYTYIWSNGVTEVYIIPSEPGLYCVTVTDSQGCSGVACHQYDWLNLEMERNHTTCGFDNGSIVITASNTYTPGVNFLWSNGATTSTISGLSSGIYAVTATYRNCTEIIENIEINSSDSISVFVEVIDESCGQKNGWISVYPEGDNPNFAYFWSNGEQTQVITDLAAGTYTVTIVDDDLCEAVRTAIVNSTNDFYVTNTDTHTSCGLNNGSITANPVGKGALYYNWSNGETTQTISDLPPGEYTVTVTSDEGCEAIATSIIDASGQIEIDADIIHTSCNLGNGSITVNPTNSYGFSYLWSTGDTAQTLTNLEAGNYTVTVTAVGGCSEEQTITVNESSTEIEAAFDVIHTSCGLNDGTITANPIGNLEFTYSWSTGDTTQSITDLAPGNYMVTVTAVGGCSNEFSTTVQPSNKLLVSNKVTQPQCFENTGSILVEPVNGNTFAYIWSTGDTTQWVTNLAPGNYTVTVTNEAGCSASATSTILKSKTLTLTVLTFEETCDGCNDASLTALADGNAPYTYEWSNGSTTQSIDDLEPGVYAVTVTDDLGCSQSEVIVINRLGCEPPTVEAIATDAPCYGDNGTVKVGLTGGLAPFTYAWTSGASSSEVELPAGKHAVIVTDSLGCIGYAAVEIKQPEAIEVSIQVTDEQCYGEENGSIAVEVSGAFPPFTYAWSQGSTESTLTGLSPEDYTATITDANGCSVEIAATVGEATQLEVPIVGDTLVCYGEAGTIEVALGYVSYEWSTGDSTSTISWTESGDYTVTVTNEQGCTAIATLTTTVNDVLEAIINKEDNGFVLEVKGGTSPYTYLWSTG
ncbi:MAG: hypothetical protein LC107_14535, partial [Chitinophagales bacterium]|nr:hypothetical protein [Chitinophagales bacterium]